MTDKIQFNFQAVFDALCTKQCLVSYNQQICYLHSY